MPGDMPGDMPRITLTVIPKCFSESSSWTSSGTIYSLARRGGRIYHAPALISARSYDKSL
jgi:hypothetical protein